MRQPCDLLLTNALVVTMDEQFNVHASGLGRHQPAAGSSPSATSPRDFEPVERVDCRGRVVMPGLVNAHTHAPMTLLRGLADDLRLDVWLMGYMMPVEREFVRAGLRRARHRAGLRRDDPLGHDLLCRHVLLRGRGRRGDGGSGAPRALRADRPEVPDAGCGQLRRRAAVGARVHRDSGRGIRSIVPSVAPHAPYTCTAEIFRACAELASEFDVPLHTHLAETALEVERARKEYGMPVVPWAKKQRLFDARVLAAHCVHVDEGEIRTLRDAHAGVAHNPTSNLKLGSGVAPVAKMIELGLNVGIGTDGAASNNDLDMFEETRLAALVAKGISGDPTAIPARTALAMATRLGARAMHLGDITGSLEPGKRADLIVVDLDQLAHDAALHTRRQRPSTRNWSTPQSRPTSST